MTPKRFKLERDKDVSGVSGTGTVAFGCQFHDGVIALRWCTPGMPHSTNVYDNIKALLRIHGHGISTRVVWIDHGGNT
jgi:hypothetical protein